MMENKQSSLFSVTFFNGEKELDMGIIPITPSLTFKSFQSLMSQKLQISPHQITIYFERKNFIPSFNQNHHRRRHPVTSKFDFSSIMTESNSAFFWVVQKRSRRIRRRRTKNSFPGEINVNNMILRRNLKMLEEKEKENYLMSLSLNSNVYNDLGFLYGYRGEFYNFSDDGASSSGGGSSIENHRTCEVCFLSATGVETPPFHCCKNDAITHFFKSSAGPIGPPKKNLNHLG